MNKISVVIPIYKGQKYIESLLCMFHGMEEHSQLELIFVNDAPEEPLDIESPLFHGKIIENNKNLGIHGSRIAGLKAATGEYILFLDQDDSLSSDYFCSQLTKIGDADAVFCNGIYRGGQLIFSQKNPQRENYDFEEYLEHGYPLVSLGQLLLRTDKIPIEWQEHIMIENGWDDHFLWACLMKNRCRVHINTEVLYTHEEDGNNASFRWDRMAESGKNFQNLFVGIDFMTDEEKEKFYRLTDAKIQKYEMYHKMSGLRDISLERLEDIFRQRRYRTVAIYGMGVFGKQLYDLLKQTSVYVAYGIDGRKDICGVNIPIKSPEEELEPVDVTVVTPIFDYESICEKLEQKNINKVVSLLELLE